MVTNEHIRNLCISLSVLLSFMFRYGIKFSFSLPGFGNSITYKTEYAQLVVKKVAIKGL